MEITAGMIKELKEKTGAGIVECKQVLNETKGEMNKAVEILRAKGLSKAEKKAGRAANEGTVMAKFEGKKGLVVKVNCETDFVAKTDDFKKFVTDVTDLIFKKGYQFSTELPSDLEDLRKNVIAKLGENILVSDWKFIEGKGELYSYLHKDKFSVKIAVIADFTVSKKDSESEDLLKNITMQITAMNPIAVDPASIPSEKLESVKKDFMEEAKQTGKPEKVIENIVKGKLEKFYSEAVLTEQSFILDEEKKVKTVLEEAKNKGVDLKIHSFVRVSL